MISERLDLALIAVYVVAVAVVGLMLRGRQRAVGDYFLGGRDIPWPLVLLSIVATETSTVTFLSVPGVAYGGDLTFLQLPLGYIAGRLLVAIFLLPRYFHGEPLTLYEVIGRRFGPLLQRLTSGIFVLTRSLADGLRLYLTAIVIYELTGWPFAVAVAALGAVTIAYTFLGGFRAVVWTDALQFVVYMGGALVAGWILVGQIDGGFFEAMRLAGAEGKLRFFDPSFDLSLPFTFWAGLLGGAFLSAASHGADQMMVQRCLASRSLGQARTALTLSAVVVFFQFAVFLVLGLLLWVFYRGAAFDSGDQVFARFIAQELPLGIRGLIVAAALSAAMSTLSSSLNSISSALVNDFYRPLVADAEERSLRLARALTVVAGLVQIGVAIVSQQRGASRSTVLAVITIAAFTTGLTLGVLVLAAAVRRIRERTAVVAMAIGAAAVTTVWAATDVAGPWYALVGSGTTVLAGWVLSRWDPD